jgi:hypothetical protein
MIFELRLGLSIVCSDMYLQGVSPEADIARVIRGWLRTWALLLKLRPTYFLSKYDH